MRNPRLSRWKDVPACIGLLLVAQKIEEALFDYTLDTYKAPALNTHTRCIELSRAIADVRSAGLPEQGLQPMIEELAFSIRRDTAAQTLLGPYITQFARPDYWKGQSLEELQTSADFVRSHLRGRYLGELIRQLNLLIPEPREKERILFLTMDLTVEWMNAGFSANYIYYTTRSFFFGFGGPAISTPSQFSDFVRLFEVRKRKWKVLLRTSDSFKDFQTVLPSEIGVLMNEAPAPKSQLRRERDFLLAPHDGPYLLLNNIEAADARAAQDSASTQLQTISSAVSLHVHRIPFYWEKNVIVYDQDDHPIVLRESPTAMLKHPECSLEDLPATFAMTVNAFAPPRLPSESWARFHAVLNLHATAVGSSSVETQLTSLWAALESLLPKSLAEAKISAIATNVVPILAREYPRKLIGYLYSDLTSCVPTTYRHLLTELPDELSDVEKCAAIVCVDSNSALRDQLFEATDKNPLLRFRIWDLQKRFSDAQSIHQAIEEHTTRVGWHLRRVYRSRNLLVHSGRTLPYRDVIVENLHSYLHRILDLLTEVLLREPHPKDLNGGFLAIRMEHEAHLATLASAKKTGCSMDNFRQLLFGR
jgi:hypothetical protein